MFPASSNEKGQCMAFPDACKTPTPGGPVPMPYPNIAMLNQASGGTLSSKVKIMGSKAATKNTEISMSSGDEAGSAGGGVVSNKFKGPAKFKQGSSKVKIEGHEAAYLGAMVGQNDASNSNMPAGHQVAPSQTKVMVSG
jgi:uncharacterized Zn-binding protein involved in type VI secretion